MEYELKPELMIRDSTTRILLIPGLFESGLAMLPMRRFFRRYYDHVEIFPDRIAFRNLDDSVQRLSQQICVNAPCVLVTHSFGDWVARQAIANTPDHTVVAIASLAPAIKPGWLLKLLNTVTMGVIPEVAVAVDARTNTQRPGIDPTIHQILMWADYDDTVRPIVLPNDSDTISESILATHMSIIFQPNVQRRILSFLQEFLPLG